MLSINTIWNKLLNILIDFFWLLTLASPLTEYYIVYQIFLADIFYITLNNICFLEIITLTPIRQLSLACYR